VLAPAENEHNQMKFKREEGLIVQANQAAQRLSKGRRRKKKSSLPAEKQEMKGGG